MRDTFLFPRPIITLVLQFFIIFSKCHILVLFCVNSQCGQVGNARHSCCTGQDIVQARVLLHYMSCLYTSLTRPTPSTLVCVKQCSWKLKQKFFHYCSFVTVENGLMRNNKEIKIKPTEMVKRIREKTEKIVKRLRETEISRKYS